MHDLFVLKLSSEEVSSGRIFERIIGPFESQETIDNWLSQNGFKRAEGEDITRANAAKECRFVQKNNDGEFAIKFSPLKNVIIIRSRLHNPDECKCELAL